MSKNGKIGFALGTVVLMVLLVWMFSSGEQKQKSHRPTFVSSNWTKKFQLYDKKPLGLFLFTKLSVAHLDTNNSQIEIENWIQLDTLLQQRNEPKTFLFVGNHFGLKNSEMDTILKHVYRGSDLFLSYNDLTENLYAKVNRARTDPGITDLKC